MRLTSIMRGMELSLSGQSSVIYILFEKLNRGRQPTDFDQSFQSFGATYANGPDAITLYVTAHGPHCFTHYIGMYHSFENTTIGEIHGFSGASSDLRRIE